MAAPAPARKAKKTIDQCLKEFHRCMTTSTLAPAPRAASAPAARAASAPAARAASAPAARTASAPAARAVSNYVMKPGVSAYGGDPNLASKRLNSVTGTVDQCKAACDANAKCTHFTQTGSSCQLYSGGEWVGTQPGTNSYCKSQCQGGDPAPSARAAVAPTTLKGKVVRVERADGKNEYINLLGIDVFDANGAKITATPTLGPVQYANPANFGPQFLVDGVRAENGPSGLRLPHTERSPAAFMQLNLGSDKAISKIVIYNRTACCMDRINGCVLKVLNAAGAILVTIPLTGAKAVYTFSAPLTNSSTSSTYMMEGAPFVLTGYGGPGPNWKLILTLLVLAILLWILAKKM